MIGAAEIGDSGLGVVAEAVERLFDDRRTSAQALGGVGVRPGDQLGRKAHLDKASTHGKADCNDKNPGKQGQKVGEGEGRLVVVTGEFSGVARKGVG
jgi:hypothetical protein